MTQPAQLTPELLAAAAAAIVSIVLSYMPNLRVKWAALAEETKQAVMVGLMLATGIIIYALACTPETGFPFVACPQGGFWSLFQILLVAVLTNQGVHRISPKPADVRAVIKARKV